MATIASTTSSGEQFVDVQHRVGRRPVLRLTVGEQPPHVTLGIAVEQRTVLAARGPGRQHGRIRSQPHDSGTGRAQRVAVLLPVEHAASRGEHERLVRSERCGERLRLQLPKRRFAVDLEDLPHRAPGARLDELVGVDEAPPEPLGEQAPHRRLAGAHHPHEDDVRCHVS